MFSADSLIVFIRLDRVESTGIPPISWDRVPRQRTRSGVSSRHTRAKGKGAVATFEASRTASKAPWPS
jgi:hypothetical protein